jgi:bifunctional ADP-heptose synthase (sugar kinase/adenylyltransferase)
MFLLTPTEREARLAVRDFNSGLVILAEQLREKSQSKNILLTLGAEGVLIHACTDYKNKWLTDRLPAFNTAPKDISGAGDSMLIGASMALAVGADIWQSSYIGSICASCQIGRIGNTQLSRDEIITEINR